MCALQLVRCTASTLCTAFKYEKYCYLVLSLFCCPLVCTGTDVLRGLQHIHKAPITKVKQIDHVLNERRLLEAAGSNFCVRLLGAFQDAKDLMLLQEWVGGAFLRIYVPGKLGLCSAGRLSQLLTSGCQARLSERQGPHLHVRPVYAAV